MGKFEVQLPDGSKFEVEAPDGTSNEQIIAAVQNQINQKPEEKPEEETVSPTYEGALQETGEGIVSGLIAIPQGIAELGASLIDVAADTNLSQSVTETADELRAQLGIDPEGLAGKLTETVTQFVIPGLGAASVVSKISKLGKLARTGSNLSKSQKVGLLGQQVAAAGIADAAVSTDGITTIGDFFEGGFTETDRTVGLDGRDEALRRIGNKLKVGVETSAIVGSLPTVFKGVREGLKGTTALTRTVGEATGLDRPVSAAVASVAKQLKKPIEAGQKIIKDAEERVVFRADEASLADNMIVGVNRALGYRGVLPQDVADFRANIPLQTGEELRTATLNFNRIEKDLDKVIKEFNEQLGDQTSGLTRQSFYDNIFDFMTSGKNIEEYASIPASKRAEIKAARDHLTKLSKDVLKSDVLTNLRKMDAITTGRFKGKTGEEAYNVIKNEFEKNFNKYLRRRYRIFEAKKGTFKPGDQEVEEAITGYLNDKNMLGSELREFVNNAKVNTTGKTFADLGIDEMGNLVGAPTREQAEIAVKGFLGRYGYGVRKLGPSVQGKGTIQDQAIDHTLFTERVQLTDYQRKLIGEIKDPVEAYFGTVSDLSSFMATDRYFRNIRNMVESNPNGSIAKFFTPSSSEAPIGYKTLTGRSGDKSNILTSYGSLEGFHVPPKVKDDLDRFIIGDLGTIGNAARQLYGNYFLRAKGATQYAKTVLSPVTQIRNFTTATLFATMQGNIGKGANLLESVKIAFSDLKNLPPEEAVTKLKEYDRLGLLGTQPEIQEIKKLIDEGFGFQGSNEVVNGQRVGREFGSRFTDNTFGNFLNKKVLKKLEKAYQASDNTFKIYNFEFEKTKLNNVLTKSSTEDKLNYFTRVLGQDKVNALRVGDDGVNLTNDQLVGRLLNERSADIVKNTVPNYNLTPEFIKGLRKLPFGNFVSFPYEIIRTSGNTIKLALDEMADPLTQNIGLRRMSGTLFTLGAVPYATTQLAYKLSGVSPEEMEAYQRSFAPPWEKNARLIPVGRTEDGKILYNNFSYFTPYGDLEKIAMGAFNKFDEVRNEGGGFDKAIFQGFMESFGELFKPYTEEAIIFAKLRDVADPKSENILTKVFGRVVGGRGGSTELGARVYNEQDSIGDKMAKSFKHIMDGFMPGAVPFNVRGGEFVSGDFTRSIFGGHLGITEKDRLGRQPKLYREFYGALLGGTNEMDPELALKFKGYEFSEARKNSSSIFNSVARRANVSKEELLEAYKNGNEARFRVFNEFYAIVQDLKRLGKSEREIIKLFKQNGVTGIRDLVRGRYEPLPNAAITIRRAMRREGTIGEYPRDEINQILKEQNNRKFTATSIDKQEQTPVEEKSRPIPFTRTKSPVTTAPVQTGNINTGQQINSSLVSLLGSNPIEAAKNMEILQRRNQ